VNTSLFDEFRCGGVNICARGFGSSLTNWQASHVPQSTLTGRAVNSVDEPGSLGLLRAAAALALIARRRRAAVEKSGG
jgi:hypothetical protein